MTILLAADTTSAYGTAIVVEGMATFSMITDDGALLDTDSIELLLSPGYPDEILIGHLTAKERVKTFVGYGTVIPRRRVVSSAVGVFVEGLTSEV